MEERPGMEIDLLRTFVAICETRSFTAAARVVGRSQSAVSLQVRRLEDSLGRPLFQRGVPGAILTEHGALLLPRARAILDAVRETLGAFDRATGEGVFVVGMPDDYVPRLLAPVLRVATTLYPAAVVDVVIDESRTLVRRLADGSVDLAFVTEGEGPVAGGPVAFTDEMVWVAPPVGDLHHAEPLPIALWDDDQDSYGIALRARLAELDRAYRVVVVTRSMSGLRGAVASGVAVTVMMRSSVTPGLRVLNAADGFAPLARLSVRLEKAHLKRSPVVDRLRDAIVAAVSDPDTAIP
jgi:DNA-binding transcriptional LysR family regulator